MTKTKVPPKLWTFVFRCLWPSTAIEVKVEARDESSARMKVERELMKSDGWIHCMRIDLKEVI